MGKYCGDSHSAYNANRSSGAGRSRSFDAPCHAGRTERAEEVCREAEMREACREESRYVWRGAETGSTECVRREARMHLHEVQGSVQTSGNGCAAHAHRLAAMTMEPVTLPDGGHAHRVVFRTDSCGGHFHEFSGCTSEAFDICAGHVHYLEGRTGEQAGHCHEFRLATLLENPQAESGGGA